MRLRDQLYDIIFEADTKAGKRFDIVLLLAIVLSIIVVMLESVPSIKDNYGDFLISIEWVLTILFTIEYGLRIWISKVTKKYVFSFYGIVDLISIVPSYLAMIIVGSQSLLIIRTLRLLRVFRVLKLMNFLGEANTLKYALISSSRKIIVFLFWVVTIVFIMGTVMYLVESPESGFTSIPRSVYWAVVTLTTVGYGDIAPESVLGQFIASMIMILGYCIIAVPTGIVSVEMAKGVGKKCSSCNYQLPSAIKTAKFCPECGKVISD